MFVFAFQVFESSPGRLEAHNNKREALEAHPGLLFESASWLVLRETFC